MAFVALLVMTGSANAAPPTITSFAPTSANTGASVTLTGTNFIAGAANNTVKFNNVTATVTSATVTLIVATVPATGTSGKISVTNTNGTVASASDFFVLPTGYSAAQVAVMSRLTLGTGQAVAIPVSKIALLLFDTSAPNQRVFFRWSGSTIGSMSIAIKNPAGGFVVASSAGAGSSYIDTTTMATQGTYSIQITPDASFSGALTVTVSAVAADVTAAVTASTGGGAATLAIVAAGQNGRVTFTGTGGRRIFVRLAGSTIMGGAAALLDVNGAPMAIEAISSSVNGTYIDTTMLPASPASGTYTVLVDPSGLNTGTITVTVYDVGVSDPAPQNIATLPGSAVVTTDAPGINAALTFTIAAGHKVAVKMTGSTFTSVNLSLRKPDGSQLGTAMTAHAATAFVDAVAVTGAGLHSLRIDPTGAAFGTATFTVYDITSDVGGSVVLTSPAPSAANGTLTTTTPGQNPAITFAGTAGMRVALSIGTSTIPSGQVSILAPGGSTVATGALAKGSFVDVAPLATTGTFTVRFDPGDSAVGTVTYVLYNVPADIGSPTPIGIVPAGTATGGSGAATITTPGQNAWFSFAGTSGQRLAFKVAGTFIKSGTLTILNPSDAPVGAPVTFGTAGGFGDGYTLPTTGTYKIFANANGLNTGNVVVAAFLVPADATGSVTAGGPATTVGTTVPGQNIRVTFAGVAGRGALVQVSASTISSGTVRVLRADGTTVLGTGTLSTSGGVVDTVALPATETYTVLVDPKNAVIGAGAVQVFDVPGDVTAALPMNGTPVVLTTTPGQNISLSLAATAGQKLALHVSGPGFSGTVKVIRPDASQMSSKTFNTVGVFVDAAVVTVTGTHTVRVDPSGTGFGNVTVTAYSVPADVDGGTVTAGGAAVRVATTVPGQNGVLTFTGVAQASMRLVMAGVTTGTSTCCGAKVSVIGPGAVTTMLPKNVGTNGAAFTFTLPSSGSYTIKLDPLNAAVGGVTFTLEPNA